MSWLGLRPTARGLTLLAIGIGITVAGAWLGEPDIAWVGLLLVLLPLLGSVIVLAFKPSLQVDRTVEPAEVPLGGQAKMSLLLHNLRPISLAALSFKDAAPSEFEADAHFSLSRGIGRWKQPVYYDLETEQRGHFRLGPLSATVHDPLGLATRTWAVKDQQATLRVTPRIWELSRLDGDMGSGSAGDATPQRIGTAGQDDVLLREHRYGDDLRRVHWRMSAKQGELMVRLEEQPWDPAVTILLDTRASAHVGLGPNSTLEWVISLGASVADQLLSARHRIAIVSADSPVMAPGEVDTQSANRHMLHRLTDLRPSPETTLLSALADPEPFSNARSLIAGLGVLGNTDVAALTSISDRMAECTALVPDTRKFSLNTASARSHEEACQMLTSHGWVLQPYGPGDNIPNAWAELLAHRDAS